MDKGGRGVPRPHTGEEEEKEEEEEYEMVLKQRFYFSKMARKLS